MAQIDSELTFTGSLGNLSAYKMRGVDKIILRTKGGASKEKIKTSPAFANTRRVNAEFGGRARASKWIMQAMWPQKALADYNIAGPLNALLKPVQDLDTSNGWGKRNVQLSRNPKLLEGFSLNRKAMFDSVVRTSLTWSISKETHSARIDIPALIPGINFFAAERNPLFSIVAVLGVVPDLFYNEHGYAPLAPGYDQVPLAEVRTEWYPVRGGASATSLTLQSPTPPDAAFSLLLSIGISYGTMLNATTVNQVKYTGSAKVLGMI